MRIDAYTHFIPKKFYDQVIDKGGHSDIGKRVRHATDHVLAHDAHKPAFV